MKKPLPSYPLPFRLPSAPAVSSTVIIYSSAAKNYSDIALILTAGFLVSLICYAILIVAGRIRQLGTTGLTILNRIMGMMLAAISVEIIVAGLKSIFPQLVA